RSTAQGQNCCFVEPRDARTGQERDGGEGGIRTHGTLAGTTVFETAPIDHSGTSPHIKVWFAEGGRTIATAGAGRKPAGKSLRPDRFGADSRRIRPERLPRRLAGWASVA